MLEKDYIVRFLGSFGCLEGLLPQFIQANFFCALIKASRLQHPSQCHTPAPPFMSSLRLYFLGFLLLSPPVPDLLSVTLVFGARFTSLRKCLPLLWACKRWSNGKAAQLNKYLLYLLYFNPLWLPRKQEGKIRSTKAQHTRSACIISSLRFHGLSNLVEKLYNRIQHLEADIRWQLAFLYLTSWRYMMLVASTVPIVWKTLLSVTWRFSFLFCFLFLCVTL